MKVEDEIYCECGNYIFRLAKGNDGNLNFKCEDCQRLYSINWEVKEKSKLGGEK